jgi:methylphosphotriester-DNA--protein-cysteine methyltransferase
MVPTLSSSRRVEQPAAAVAYREWAPPPALAPWVRRVWELTVPGSGGAGRVLPDGCMDIVVIGGALLVAGPDTGPVPIARRAGETVTGIRFHPGAGPAVLGPRASELRDARVPLDAVWGRDGRELQERVAAAAPPAGLAVLQARLLARLDAAARPDPLVAAAVGLLEDPPARPDRVGGLGTVLGVGDRQLRRRFLAAVGYGPKTLARVLRFQRLLGLLDGAPVAGPPVGPRGPSLAAAAAEAGYADQAHMTAECGRLAGLPPAALLAERRRTAQPA